MNAHLRDSDAHARSASTDAAYLAALTAAATALPPGDSEAANATLEDLRHLDAKLQLQRKVLVARAEKHTAGRGLHSSTFQLNQSRF